MQSRYKNSIVLYTTKKTYIKHICKILANIKKIQYVQVTKLRLSLAGKPLLNLGHVKI
jgi:hypothetical protein